MRSVDLLATSLPTTRRLTEFSFDGAIALETSLKSRGHAPTIASVVDMLQVSAGYPEVRFAPGEPVVHEGTSSGAIWILVSGALTVRKGDVPVNVVTHPGAMIGEIAVLLGVGHSATVEASQPSTLRYVADGDSLLSSDPAITRQVAADLANRLSFLTTYLADLTHQYGDAPGLSMVSDVLHQLENRRAPVARPGSARDPDPEY